MSFRGKYMAWSDLPYDKRNESEEKKIGPAYYPTDFGACCLFVPHLDFEPFNKSVPVEQLYHELKADSLNGETNGLKLVLDAEQFNYALKSVEGAGFKLSLHHHSDKPMTQFSTQLINSGQGFMNKNLMTGPLGAGPLGAGPMGQGTIKYSFKGVTHHKTLVYRNPCQRETYHKLHN
jgi:hypothetical protein